MTHTLISMIRGINVGGNNRVKMDRLREIYGKLGFANLRTYLQSGNVVFDSESADADAHGLAIEAALFKQCGLELTVGVRTAKAFTAAFRANPLAGRPAIEARFLHATFLVRAVGKPSLGDLDLPLGPAEQAVLVKDVLYLYCPNGYGTTKINNTFFERKLKVRATTRNWQTVTALEAMGRGKALP